MEVACAQRVMTSPVPHETYPTEGPKKRLTFVKTEMAHLKKNLTARMLSHCKAYGKANDFDAKMCIIMKYLTSEA